MQDFRDWRPAPEWFDDAVSLAAAVVAVVGALTALTVLIWSGFALL